MIEVEANGRKRLFATGSNVDAVLMGVVEIFGPCSSKTPFLVEQSTGAIFIQGCKLSLPSGAYTYELKEKTQFHHRFGHLVAPSSYDFQTTRLVQQDSRHRNLNFRPHTAAPFLPLQLVHKVFGSFLDDVRSGDLQPTQQDYDFFLHLAVAASEMLEETPLRKLVKDICKGYLSELVVTYMGAIKAGRGTATDVGSLARKGDVILWLCEVKKAICGTGTDPQMQGIGNYKSHWTKCSEPELFSDTAYPAFLLELVGQSLKIGGLVQVGAKVCYQPLASVDLFAIHRHDYSMAEEGVKVLMALKKALASLQEYWVSLVVSGTTPNAITETLIHSKKLPYPLLPFGERVEQIGNRLVYEVRGGMSVKYPDDYMVKFVQGYGMRIHYAWARAGFAPKVHAVFKGPGGGWKWLAMELLKAEDGWICLAALEAKVADGLRGKIVSDYLDKAHKIEVVDVDGSRRYAAHGDMRDDNVMVLLDGQNKLKDVKFIDFDWAKVEGGHNAVYPGFMNVSVNWPAGVQAGGPMLRVHDRSLLMVARGKQLKDKDDVENRSKRPRLLDLEEDEDLEEEEEDYDENLEQEMMKRSDRS